jgi:hypothetical protein
MILCLAEDYPIQMLCDELNAPRSTVYYKPKLRPKDAVYLAAIEQILVRRPFYGYHRTTEQLQ